MTSPQPVPHRAPTPWGLVVLLGSLTAMAPVAIDMYLPSLPAIGKDLDASPAQIQATVAAFLTGMALGQIFYGPASDRLGRRLPVLVGVGIFILASIACALARTPDQLLAGRFIQALGACAGAVIARAAVVDRFNHAETAQMLSLMMLIMGLAPVLAPLIGGFLLAAGWPAIFWFQAAFGVALALAAWLRFKESRSEETARLARSEHPVRAYLALMRNRRLVGYAAAGALNGATLFTYISSSPDLLIGAYGIAPAAFGWVFGVNAAGLIGMNEVNRRLLRRRSPDQVLAMVSLLSIIPALALVLAAFLNGGPFVVLPLLFLVLASFGLMQGNTTAGALNVEPLRAGTASAVMGALSFLAGAGASTVAGLLHDGTARPMAVVICVATVGAAIALRTLALPRGRQA